MKYSLIQAKYRLIQLTNAESRPVKHFNKRYFFCDDIDDATCYKLDYIVDYLFENGILKSTITLAERETKSSMFYCRFFRETGERCNCGKQCKAYEPRNGKYGACKHFGYTYSDTKIEFELKIMESIQN